MRSFSSCQPFSGLTPAVRRGVRVYQERPNKRYIVFYKNINLNFLQCNSQTKSSHLKRTTWKVNYICFTLYITKLYCQKNKFKI